MILAAHQPNYLPNLDYFSKMKKADIFVISTNIRRDTREKWQVRHKIPIREKDVWLTVPTNGSEHQQIKEVRIVNNNNWARKHIMTLRNTYNKKDGGKFIQEFEDIYAKKWERLADLNFALIERIKNILEIPTKLVLEEEVTGKKHQLFIEMCKKYGADTYLSGNGAKAYVTQEALEDMEKNDIKHVFIDSYLGPEYPYSTVHYLFTHGKKWIKNVI